MLGSDRDHACEGVRAWTLEGRVCYTILEVKEEGAFRFRKFTSMEYCFRVTL